METSLLGVIQYPFENCIPLFIGIGIYLAY